MTKFAEFTGKSEAQAIENALTALGLERDEVSVEVLERAKTGFLGIGSTPARIKVTYEGPDDEPEAPAQEISVQEAPAQEVSASVEEPEAEEPAPAQGVLERPVTHPVDDDASQAISAFLSGLLEHMGIDAAASVSLSERGSYEVVLDGPDLGGVIGRRGETLDAIQQLTGYAVNRGRSPRVRIHLDAEGYRARREESLAAMARKTAEKVIRTRRNITLEPMNAYERHVVHTALQGYPHISTHSTGVEPSRRTVVCYEVEEWQDSEEE